jgi:acetyltransferase
MKRNIWECFTNPKAVAVVGASEKQGSVGSAVMLNLGAGSFKGEVYPVNPKRDSVHGHKAYPSLSVLPPGVDLVVIATPAATVPDLIRQCGDAGIPAAIVVSAGFEEAGAAGQELMKELRAAALQGGVRVIGPNCLGFISPYSGLNASFGSVAPQPGSVAFLSQSGALGTAILDWTVKEKIGMSVFVSLGSMVDMSWAAMIDYLSTDPNTKSIVIYMESIGNAREFLSAARELALYKPIIVLKAGRHAEGAKAAMSHTGSMAGSDDVLDAAFDRCGIFRVKTIAELFYMAEALSKQPRPQGPRLAIVTNAGGPGVLATDALADEGGRLAQIAPETLASLDAILPASWSKGNPIDVLGDASPEKYCQAVQYALADPNVDSVLTVLTPQAMTNPTAVAKAIAALPNTNNKPLLASWMGGDTVAEGEAILQAAGVPCFPYPDTAARIMQYMWQYGERLRNLYETPQQVDDDASVQPDRMLAVTIIDKARKSGRNLLTEYESKQLFQAYGLPTVDTWLAETADEAVDVARRAGFPVVLKLNSTIVTHKAKVGGVRLNLEDADAVRAAFIGIKEAVTENVSAEAFEGVTVQRMVRFEGFELILGSKIDIQFGPVLLLGNGGAYAEAIHDFAMGLPPLNTTLANRMLHKIRAFKVLNQIAKKSPQIMPELERVLVIFSRMVLDHAAISEMEINPLLVADKGLVALDARVTLNPIGSETLTLPAIAPYPTRYVRHWTTKHGDEVTIRPIRPEDEPEMVGFHNRLSDSSVYHRYFSLLALDQRVSHERLAKMCFIDYDRQIALVVEEKNPKTGIPEISAVGRLVRGNRTQDAEYAIIVADEWQGRGIGTELLRRLLECARDMQVERVTADILPDNFIMQHISEKVGFELKRDADQKFVTVTRVLSKPSANATA